MARFLLVHGASHGAWCWRDVVPALIAHGHAVTAIDLPSHGADPTPAAAIGLQDYIDAILAALPEPALVVAHSMAGVPATGAADRTPERVQRLVYLCAYRPEDGDSVAGLRRAQAEQPLLPAIRRDPDGVTFRFDPTMAPELFYHDCSAADRAYALERLVPQAIRPQAEPVTLTGAINSVPRSYILCNEDRAIPPRDQQRMAAVLPSSDVHVRPWSHSPFLATPEALASLLADIAAS
ncbi:alpha/beta fold hydrolase [Salipiger sp.]|uniref:alpha/beta fold hydrolase n=1 Tax=Salipiger sp. TaxID=2078585 RepID=UPI003A97B552